MVDENLKKISELKYKINDEINELVLLDEKLDSVKYKIKCCDDDFELAELYDVKQQIENDRRKRNNRMLIYKNVEKKCINKIGSVGYENDSNY